ncbi:bifunctional PIG-L family deacetylase/class I SAM-dependent methyltransferase [Glutamicibacter sp.]|uniref:bifunctional PIG-L family deacetylase/class I SAM-dependent methyltransferase n=1 Tax=Glutamicibacter sp. TaxID=1931995 RepID=UPI0028BD2C8D|nr:bifunctional PIG-L family deacetylase/class I SAM-dependent methyltransferase [Glutamicibacter sp.]
MVNFSHLDAGTTAAAWDRQGLQNLELLPLQEIFGDARRLIVVAAHPDDETLGTAGLIQQAQRSGMEVELILCSNGEASHPHSPTLCPKQLSERRVAELVQAIAAIDLDASGKGICLRSLGLPDGKLAEHRGKLDAILRAEAAGGDCLIASTYRGDGHSDHETVGESAAQAAQESGIVHLEFPLWYWHWAAPEEQEQWRHWYQLPLDESMLQRKSAALSEHTSQTQPLSNEPGDEALLSPEFLAHFARPQEFFRLTRPGHRDAATAEIVFEQLYQARPDPWNYRSSAYEQRKRRILLASLPRERYSSALELGCSIGIQTAALGRRCDALLGIDSSQSALEHAHRETSGMQRVELLQANLPAQWPDLDPDSVDLVVLSEIGYFLAADELAELLYHSSQTLRAGGDLLLCHWLHPIEGWPLDGRDVHRIAHRLNWPRVVLHEEPDFLLEVLRKPGVGDG